MFSYAFLLPERPSSPKGVWSKPGHWAHMVFAFDTLSFSRYLREEGVATDPAELLHRVNRLAAGVTAPAIIRHGFRARPRPSRRLPSLTLRQAPQDEGFETPALLPRSVLTSPTQTDRPPNGPAG